MLQTMTRAMVDAVFPPRCLACPTPTETAGRLCAACWRETHFIAGTTCRRCGAPLHGDAGAEDVCERCLRHPPAWDRGAAALLYGGSGRRMVLALKHGDRLDIVGPLAAWMAAAGRPLLAEADVIAPVPLHWIRLLRRRYNQSAELARGIGRIAGKPVVPDLLVRRRATTPQEGGREARAANQAGAIALAPRRSVAGRRILLIDDVLTTGATLSTCTEALRGAGAAGVDVLVLARVAFDESLGL
ncbi:ComF family protein [Amaricoccus sp.]|uniref:ComF family protein n=1 Tax=Amaricoccus sp. TaxID=1872485 RepID=UPI0039E25D17